ncbi:Lachrymatory-factor synthase [Bienertia sinuspersici]
MIRCCESSQFPGGGIQWAKERLIMIDSSKMSLSYDIVDNNAGFNSYVATIRLFPINGDDDDGDGDEKCKFVWSFVADPIQGFTQESLCEFFNGMVKTMGKKMEDACSSHN